jgi:hypothetical protein
MAGIGRGVPPERGAGTVETVSPGFAGEVARGVVEPELVLLLLLELDIAAVCIGLIFLCILGDVRAGRQYLEDIFRVMIDVRVGWKCLVQEVALQGARRQGKFWKRSKRKCE